MSRRHWQNQGHPGAAFAHNFHWRLLLLPFGSGEEVLPLRLWLSDEAAGRGGGGRGAAGDDDDPPCRAIFELELARRGRFQLDALCHRRSFRLMVRSERVLEAPLRREIGEIFLATCGAAGLAGELGFAPAALLRLPEPPRLAGASACA